MKLKLEEFFQLNVYERYYFQNFAIFSNTMHTTKDLLPDWDESLGKVERAIDWDESLGKAERAIVVLEFKQEFAPSISTKELEIVLD